MKIQNVNYSSKISKCYGNRVDLVRTIGVGTSTQNDYSTISRDVLQRISSDQLIISCVYSQNLRSRENLSVPREQIIRETRELLHPVHHSSFN